MQHTSRKFVPVQRWISFSLTLFLLPALVSACRHKEPGVERATMDASTPQSEVPKSRAERWRLVSINGSLPYRTDERVARLRVGCLREFYGGELEILDSVYTLRDNAQVSCLNGLQADTVTKGRIRIRDSVVTFFAENKVSHELVFADEGRIRGDTMMTGEPFSDSERRQYVRVRRPQ